MPKPLSFLLVAVLLFAPVAIAGPPVEPVDPDPVLKLSAGSFRPNAPREAAPDWFRADPVDRSLSGRRFVVAVTRGPLDAEQRRRMESAGAEILDYFPENGYRLRVAPGADEAVRALPFVTWVGPIPPHFKVEPGLAALAERPASATRIRVLLAAGESESRVLSILDGLPATARPSGKDLAWRVDATVPADRLASILSGLAVLPEVEAVEQPRSLRYLNQDGVWVHQSFVGPSPQETPVFDRGIFGCDQVVAVADSGQDHDICYFLDTLNGPPPVYTCLTAPCPAAPWTRRSARTSSITTGRAHRTGEDDTCPATVGAGAATGPTPRDRSRVTPGLRRLRGATRPPAATAATVRRPAPGWSCRNWATAWSTSIDRRRDDLEHRRRGLPERRAHPLVLLGRGCCHDLSGPAFRAASSPTTRWPATRTWPCGPIRTCCWSSPRATPACSARRRIRSSRRRWPRARSWSGGVEHGPTPATACCRESSRGPVFDGRLQADAWWRRDEPTVSAASDANPISHNCGTCSLDGTSMSAPTAAGLAALVREYYTAGYLRRGTRDTGSRLRSQRRAAQGHADRRRRTT